VSDLVSYDADDGVALIRINRPERLNALNDDVIEGLRDAWIRFRDGDERAAVLAAAGDRAFCAGADLTAPPADMSRGVPDIGVELDKPVVAAVQGHCVGGGWVLVQNCDMAVATTDAQFLYPEARAGIFGGIGASVASRIPHKVAMEFLMLGEPITAARAYEVGMVNKLVEPGAHVGEALRIAKVLAGQAPLVLAQMKRFSRDVVTRSPAEDAAIVRRDLAVIGGSEDRKEGAAAFKEKRPPKFRGV
jgi:enoyl-CoA hydratase/carnithine racemase